MDADELYFAVLAGHLAKNRVQHVAKVRKGVQALLKTAPWVPVGMYVDL